MSENKHLTLKRIGTKLRDELHVSDAPPPEDMRELLDRIAHLERLRVLRHGARQRCSR
jgi:hypothetical protein